AAAPPRGTGGGRHDGGVPDPEGLLTQQVTEDSPAARAGLASGDLIVAAAGQPVGGVDDLFGALQGAQGGTLELGVVRGSDERTVQVVFTPENEGEGWTTASAFPTPTGTASPPSCATTSPR